LKKAISAPSALCEAWEYPKPSSFSRGLRVDLKDFSLLLISGTASVDQDGKTAHAGDVRAQTHRAFDSLVAHATAMRSPFRFEPNTFAAVFMKEFTSYDMK
jgi:enamine deaminase RidA (YjgF/YER057c/UK114 family)